MRLAAPLAALALALALPAAAEKVLRVPYLSAETNFDPAFVADLYSHNIVHEKAKAWLDMFGYVDRDGDGWRDMPDGSPLTFVYTTEPDQTSRLFTQLWKKNVEAVGIRVQVKVAKWPDNRKESKLGKLQSWHLAWNADYPDGENFYQLLYGPSCGSSNDGCFQLADFDALFDKAAALPPGPERTAIYQQMAQLVAAYAPFKLSVHRKRDPMVQPWVLGWRRNHFQHEGYRYADIDLERRAKELH